MEVAMTERWTDRLVKRQRSSPPPSSICPTVILIDDDSTSDDDGTQTDAASIVFSPQGSYADDDNGMFPDLKCSPFLSGRPTLQETTRSLEPADSDGGVDLDAMFQQYLRSPSSSPEPPASPDDAGSELSGETLVNAGHGQSLDSPLLDVKPLSESTSEDLPACQVDRGLAYIGPVERRPRIRLRVNQPKIMLRLTLRSGGKIGKKGVGKKSGSGRRCPGRKR